MRSGDVEMQTQAPSVKRAIVGVPPCLGEARMLGRGWGPAAQVYYCRNGG